jgi:hypothetical protein
MDDSASSGAEDDILERGTTPMKARIFAVFAAIASLFLVAGAFGSSRP